MTVTQANRDVLRRHVRAVADIAYLFVETLPVFSRRVPEGRSAFVAASLIRLISRLNGCAGQLENWIFAPPWKDKQLVPPLIETAGRTVRCLRRWTAKLENEDVGSAGKVARACHALASDFEVMSEQLNAYAKSLGGEAAPCPLEEIALELAACHDLLEALSPSSKEVGAEPAGIDGTGERAI